MVIIRIDNDGNLVNSSPCINCARYITKIGIGKVYHS